MNYALTDRTMEGDKLQHILEVGHSRRDSNGYGLESFECWPE